MSEMTELRNQLKKIEEAWGIKAYLAITDVIYKMQMRVKDITESRETWKARYFALKGRKDEN